MKLASDNQADAFWRLRTTRVETGWLVAYIEDSGNELPVGSIETDGARFTVWFGDCESFAVSLNDFDTAVDCLRDYVDATQLGLA